MPPFRLAYIALLCSAALYGCATPKTAELPLKAGQADSVFNHPNDMQVDALGAQRGAEAHLIAGRRVKALEAQLSELEDQRKHLEAGLINLAHDNNLPSSTERERVAEYQVAEVAANQKAAALRGELSAKKALLENERERKIIALTLEHENSAAAKKRAEIAAEAEAINASLDSDISRAKEEARKVISRIETETAAEERRISDAAQEKIAAIRLDDAATQEKELRRRQSQLVGTQAAAVEVGADAQMRIIELIVEKKSLAAKLDKEHAQRAETLNAAIEGHRSALFRLERELADATRQHSTAATQISDEIKDLESQVRRIAELNTRLSTSAPSSLAPSTTSLSSQARIDLERSRLESARIELQHKSKRRVALAEAALSEKVDGYKRSAAIKLEQLAGRSQPVDRDAARLAERIEEAHADYRAAVASAEAETELKLARVVRPVITSSAVYTDVTVPAAVAPPARGATRTETQPKLDNHSHANGSATPKKARTKDSNHSHANGRNGADGVQVIRQLNPAAPPEPRVPQARGGVLGGVRAQVVEPATVTVWDVFFSYSDRRSWVRFQDYLKAYGVTGFVPKESDSGYYIHIGRFYAAGEASEKAAEISRLTNTTHVQIKQQTVPR